MRRFTRALKWAAAAAVVLGVATTTQIEGAFAATSPNLISNPGAESGPGSSNGVVVHVPNWIEIAPSNFTAVKYGATGGFPTNSSPGPSNRGKNFFAGGPTSGPNGENSPTAVQRIPLKPYVSAIQAGTAKFKVQAWLGGVGSKSDSAFVEIDFKTGEKGFGSVTGSVDIGPVTAAQRHNKTGLILQSATGTVPKGTRSVLVQLGMIGSGDGETYVDGFADNLSLVITTP